MDGFIIVNKPSGISSHNVCNQIKKQFNTKVGHSGTLDPLASGVLVIGIGKGTKLLNYLPNQTKEYKASCLLGIDTDTYDILGKSVLTSSKSVSLSEIDNTLKKLKEQKYQKPPIYSAIKVNGKKLYDYALQNKEVEIKERPIKIDKLERVSNLIVDNNHGTLPKCDILISANKGFYVRSLIHDLGIELGTYATMSSLERTRAGDFRIEDAYTLDEIKNNQFKLISIDEAFKGLDSITVNAYFKKLVSNGVILDEREYTKDNLFKVYFENKLIAIYEPIGNKKYKLVVSLGDGIE